MTPADIRKLADLLSLSGDPYNYVALKSADVVRAVESLRALAYVVEAAQVQAMNLPTLPLLTNALARVEALQP